MVSASRFSRIVSRLKGGNHLHVELTRFNCSESESAEARHPSFGVEACVSTFLSDLEKRRAVACFGEFGACSRTFPRINSCPSDPCPRA